MSLKDFLKSRISVLCFNFLCLISLLIFLFSVGNTIEILRIIFFTWIIALGVFLLIQYKNRKQAFLKLSKSMEHLDKHYLISEVIDKPVYFESKPYYYLLKKEKNKFKTVKNTK